MENIKSRSWKELNEYKANLTLTQEQRDVIVGTSLGDLGIQQIGKYSRLVFEQKNKDYLFHLHHIFQNLTRTPPKERLQQRLKTSEVKSTWYFSTKSYAGIQEYRDIFYPYGKKVVPSSLQELLTPRAVAYWYMDDGGLKNRHFSISTACFSVEEHEALRDALRDKWGIQSNIQGLATKSGYLSLYIPAASSKKFLDLVQPFIVPSMLYKIAIPIRH